MALEASGQMTINQNPAATIRQIGKTVEAYENEAVVTTIFYDKPAVGGKFNDDESWPVSR